MKFKVISLGCPKNLIDAEFIAYRLEAHGHTHTNDAETVLINTCAFISDAVRESIETIFSEAKDKKRLIVTGCMVERYREKLPGLLPEVELFIGRAYYREIENIVNKKGFFYREGSFSETYPRKVFTTPPTAFLKILEGCNNRCSYCTVPYIRGPVVSRPIEVIKEEFLWLLNLGYKEINIIGQDIGSYGIDLGTNLFSLIDELLEIDGDYFLRLMYLHPKWVDQSLLNLIKKEKRIIKYLDIPIQHSEDNILSLMNRGYSKTYIESLLGIIKDTIPECVLRTSIIVGFPGETEEDFQSLCEFIKKWKFDNLGAFMYSKEEGTTAFKFKGHTRKHLKRKRFATLMELQRHISKEQLKRFEGKDSIVVVEEKDKEVTIGRLITQAPDIDGIAFIKGKCEVGDIKPCKIIKTLDYDVIVHV